MRFVVVTGMSGGGKSTALRMLEDAGFYCVDNLPVLLIEKFVELIAADAALKAAAKDVQKQTDTLLAVIVLPLHAIRQVVKIAL